MNKLTSLRTPVELAKRYISSSSALASKKNFRKFYIPSEVRGTKSFREKQLSDKPHPSIPLETYGVRDTRIPDENENMVEVPEMIPDIIVPDLTNFDLKPYVSYRVNEFSQSEFTAEDLFNAVYSDKIVQDWNKKQLNEDGTPKTPSQEELLGAEEAFNQARKVGSDIFENKPHDGVYYYIDSEMFREEQDLRKADLEKKQAKQEAKKIKQTN